MEKWIEDLLVDVAPPEKPKFKSPLVLIHGLWSGSWYWRSWSAHFSNLGWECWAVNFRGRFEERSYDVLKELTFQDCLEDLKRMIRSTSSPPILMGHDMGGLVAQKAAEEEKARALILFSSLVPARMEAPASRNLRLLRLKYLPLIFLRRPFRLEEKDFRRDWLTSVPERRQAEVLKGMVPESSHLVAEFFNRSVEIHSERFRAPVLAVGGEQDRVVPPASMYEMAQRFGADILELPGHGHWMAADDDGEPIVRNIHRWVVQKLGEEILIEEFSGQEQNDEGE